MPNYVLVINDPNRSVTLHRGLCNSLGNDPLLQTASAERIGFDDGFDALERGFKRFLRDGECAGIV